MSAPDAWMSRVETYLAYRRRHGFKLTIDATQLRSFSRFADQIDTEGRLRVALEVAWAQASQRPNQLSWACRIEVLQGFARFCLREDPTTEILPRRFFGPAHRRLVPHIYTEAELSALLAATGLRISEALTLTNADVDLDAGVLRIREAKFHKQRLVPLHSSTTEALGVYARLRDRHVPRPTCNQFFLRDDGKGANQPNILYALQSLCLQLGWQPR